MNSRNVYGAIHDLVHTKIHHGTYNKRMKSVYIIHLKRGGKKQKKQILIYEYFNIFISQI